MLESVVRAGETSWVVVAAGTGEVTCARDSKRKKKLGSAIGVRQGERQSSSAFAGSGEDVVGLRSSVWGVEGDSKLARRLGFDPSAARLDCGEDRTSFNFRREDRGRRSVFDNGSRAHEVKEGVRGRGGCRRG